MKPPTTYGSENEETTFIRRVAAPDRPNARRRQKKRLVGVAVVLTVVAASAVVGYAAYQSASVNVQTLPATQQMAASLEVPSFLDDMGDVYYPTFDELDGNKDGVVSYEEYMAALNRVWDEDRDDIDSSNLPDDVKANLNAQLDGKIKSDTACVQKAMVPTKKRKLTFDMDHIDELYYMLEVWCFDTPIEIPQKFFDKYPSTPASPVEVPTAEGTETVSVVSPPDNGEAQVEITSPNGEVTQQTVPVVDTPEGPQAEIATPSGGIATIDVSATEAPPSSLEQAPTVQENDAITVNTADGEEKVIPQGPPSDGVQPVTIEDQNGDIREADAAVVETAGGEPQLKIETSAGSTATATIPHVEEEDQPQQDTTTPDIENGPEITNEQQPTLEVDTAAGPEQVSIESPPENDQVDVTITAPDGGETQQSLPVVDTDNGPQVVVPTPDGTVQEVPLPSPEEEGQGGYEQQGQQPTLEVDTAAGPEQVSIESPPENDQVDVTITAPDGGETQQSLPVVDTDNGPQVVVPTPDGTVQEVPLPSPEEEGQGGYEQQGQQPTLEVDTAAGPEQVSIESPPENDQVDVTITAPDGGETQQSLPVVDTDNGPQVVVPTPDGTVQEVPLPSPEEEGQGGYEQQGQQPTLEVDTAAGPEQVSIESPPENDQVDVTITAPDGGETQQSLPVVDTDNGPQVVVPTPDGTVQEVPLPSPEEEGQGGYEQQGQQPTLEVDTAAGPEQVSIESPPENDQVDVTITAPDGGETQQSLPVVDTDNGPQVVVPTPDGTVQEVPLPSPEEEGQGGYEQQGQQPTLEVDTAAGPEQVSIESPPENDQVDVTITAPDGGETQQSLPVVDTDNGPQVVVPTPDGTVQEVPLPSPEEEGQGGYEQQGQQPTLEVDTAAGPEQVSIESPPENDQVDVTITAPDGGETQQSLPVVDTDNGPQVVVPTPDGTVQEVPLPSPEEEGQGGYEQQGQQPTLEVDTAAGPEQVSIESPPENDQVDVTITAPDGGETQQSLPVVDTDNGPQVVVPTPDGTVQEVPLPSPEEEGQGGYEQQGQQPTLEVDTAAGPEQVSIESPPENDQVDVTITAPDGGETQQSLPVVDTDNGPQVVVPTPDGTVQEVPLPSPEEEGQGGYEQQGQQPTLEVDTAAGPEQVSIESPPENDQVDVTITAPDGGETQQSLPVVDTDNGPQVVVPTPDGTVQEVPLPSPEEEGQGGYEQQGQQPTLEVDTAAGPEQVSIESPPENDQVDVTITAPDGGETQQSLPVVDTDNGPQVVVPTPDGTVQEVPLPSPEEEGQGGYEQQGQQPTLEVDTAAGPEQVSIESPPENDQVDVTITAPDGGETQQSLPVVDTDNGPQVVVPTPDGTVQEVPLPSPEEEGQGGYEQQGQQPTLEVDTAAGPEQVSIESPPENDQVDVTITAPDGGETQQSLPVVDTDNGPQVVVPTPDGTVQEVPLPSPEEEGQGGYEQQGQQPTLEVDTAAGPEQVSIESPPENDQVDVTITAPDGGETQQSLPVVDTDNGPQVVVPTPDGTVQEVPLPSPEEEGQGGYEQQGQQPTLEVDTAAGPEQVSIESPPENDQVDVTITAPDGGETQQSLPVVDTDNGPQVVVPTPDGTVQEVPLPSPEEEGQGGYEQQGQQPTLEVDTAAGPEQVSIESPPENDQVDVTITAPDGGETQQSLPVVDTDNGPQVVVPTPDGTVQEVPLPISTGEENQNGFGNQETSGLGNNVEVATISEDVVNDQVEVNIKKPNGEEEDKTVRVVDYPTGAIAEIPIDHEEQPPIVVVTTSGTEEVTPIGSVENDKVEVEIKDENGDVTTKDAPVIDTSDGQKVLIQTTDGKTEDLPLPNPTPETPVEVVTSTGTEEVTPVGSVEDDRVKVEITDSTGLTKTEEVPVIDTSDGPKANIRTADGTTAEVPLQSSSSGQTPIVVATNTGTEEVTPIGSVENDKVEVEIKDSTGYVTTTDAPVIDTIEGPQIEIETTDGNTETVPLPQPTAAAPVEVVTTTGTEQVTQVGSVSDDKVTVEVTDSTGATTTEEVPVTSTADGPKAEIETPDGATAEVPISNPVTTATNGEQSAANNEEQPPIVVVTTSGTEEVTPIGSVENDKVEVEIKDENGDVTTKDAPVIDTSDGQKVLIQTTDGKTEDLPLPNPTPETPVEVVTSTGTEEVTPVGSVEDDRVKVEITDSTGLTKTEEVPVIDTSDGPKANIRTADGTTAEVPLQSSSSGQTPIVVATNTGTEEVTPIGSVENDKVEVEIKDSTGYVTTTDAPVIDTIEGPQIEIETTDGNTETVPLPQPTAAAPVEVVTTTGTEQVTQVGSVSDDKVTVEVTDSTGATTTEEVPVTSTADGPKAEIETPDGATAEVPISNPVTTATNGEQSAANNEEQPPIVVVTTSGTEEVTPIGSVENDKVEVEIKDENGDVTTKDAPVIDTSDGQKVLIQTTDGKTEDLPLPNPTPETPVEVVTSTGTEEVTPVGSVEDDRVKVEITDSTGLTKTEEVPVIDTSDGPKANIRTADGTTAEVPLQSSSSGQTPIVVATNTGTEEVTPIGSVENDKVEVEIKDSTGYVTTTDAPVIDTIEGPQIEIETTDGNTETVPLPQPTAAAPVEVVTTTGTEQVTQVGSVSDDKVTVEVTDSTGATTTEEVPVTSTADGPKAEIETPDGATAEVPISNPVTTATNGEQSAANNEEQPPIVVVTTSGTEEVTPIGSVENDKVEVEIKDENGDVTTKDAPVIDTSDGQKVLIQTTDGKTEDLPLPNPTPETPVEVVTSTGTEEVTPVGSVEDDRVKVEITDSTGLTKTEEVPVIDTSDGPKANIRTADGTTAEVPLQSSSSGQTPIVVATNTGTEEVTPIGSVENDKVEVEIKDSTGYVTTTDAPVIDTIEGPQIEIETTDGNTETVPLPQPTAVAPVEVVTTTGTEEVTQVGSVSDDKVTVEVTDSTGATTTEEVPVVSTADGPKAEIETSNGATADVPVTTGSTTQSGEHNFMTKDEFQQEISDHFSDKLKALQADAAAETAEAARKVQAYQALDDCIAQAANKFGYYGVYEQPPHFGNAVGWVINDCWAEYYG